MTDVTQYAWFGGILGCLMAFAVLGAFATVSPPCLSARCVRVALMMQYKCFVVR